MIATSFWSALGFVAVSFVLVVLLLAMISILIDIARSADLGGVAKVLWATLVIIVPVVGLLIYIAVRGRGMRGRAAANAPAERVAPGPPDSV